jgi:hypothetical protein
MGETVKVNLWGLGPEAPSLPYSKRSLALKGEASFRKKKACGVTDPTPTNYLEPYSSVTDITMTIASRNGTSLIRRQNFSLPAGCPACSFLKRASRKW